MAKTVTAGLGPRSPAGACRGIASGLLVPLLLLATLPFGSVTPGWTAVLRVAVFLAAAAALAGAGASHLRALRAPAIALLALAALAGIQALPWPSAVIEWISPEHAILAEGTAQTALLPPPAWIRPTLSPSDSLEAALWWAFAAAGLTAAGLVARDRRGKTAILAALLAGAFVQVILGFSPWRAESSSIWGVAVPGDPSRLRGTFVNPDHLAAFLELALALTFAWGWYVVQDIRVEPRPGTRAPLLVPPLLAWPVLFLTLALTGSRSGLVAALVGLAGQSLALTLRQRRSFAIPVALLAAAAGIGYAAFVNLEASFGRWIASSSHELSYGLRRAAYTGAFEIWTRFPLLGTGLGSFREAFPLVQPPEASDRLWEHAHNGYLELLATGGIVAFSILGAGLFLTLRALARRLSSAHVALDRAAALAALGALVAIGFHEVFDFGLTIPANSLALAALVGCGLVRSR